MKLATNQIAQIEETLDLNKVTYDDIKLELTDHIASDVETSIDNGVSFEIAFAEAFEKWKDLLLLQNDKFWKIKETPQLVLVRIREQLKKQLLIMGLLTVVFTVIGAGITRFYRYEEIANIVNVIYVVLFLTLILLVARYRLAIYKSKIKTTYGQQFFRLGLQTSNWAAVLGMPMLLPLHFLLKDPAQRQMVNSLLPLFLLFTNIILCWGVSTFYYLYNHLQFERKIKPFKP